MTAEERAAEGIDPLPQSLAEALEVMEGSELVAEALGEHIFEWFLRNKRGEWTRLQGARHAVRARPLPADAVDDGPDGTAARLPRPAAARARADARPRAATRGRRSSNAAIADAARAGRRLGRRGRRAPTTTPRARSRCAARCASATRRSSRCCCSSSGAQLARARAARRPLRRLLPHAVPPAASSRPGCGTCSGAPGAAPGPSSSSTATWCSTSRPTRPRSTGKPLDLTYMEYELLKFLATHPGKVFTRESCSRGCGATSTTAAPARSTSTSGACGPSSARSTPT